MTVAGHASQAHDLSGANLGHANLVGANLDTGNAIWTLEDPMDVLETLGPVALCSSLRDAMVWEAPDGATMQWTAAGEGLLDWRAIADRVPVIAPEHCIGCSICTQKCFAGALAMRPRTPAELSALREE